MAFPAAGVLGAADITRAEFQAAIEDFLAATVAGVAAHGRQVFLTSGTFTVPDGVTEILARVISGGGGAGGSWSTGNTNNATDGSNGGTSSIVRAGTTLLDAIVGIHGHRGTSAAAGTPGLASHARWADSAGGNCSMLPPYGKGGDAVDPGGGYVGGGGGASEGAFAVLAVAAGQTLTITVGAGGAGGSGSTPGGFGGASGNDGIVLLEW